MAGQAYEVPNKQFFVRTHKETPLLDPTTWRLRIDGTGVDKALELSYQELLAMPSASQRRFIECAGNGRSFFATYNGQAAPGTPWRLAVVVAEWTGVRLFTLLEQRVSD
jgi:DMSO/TMAO reductase YedYZ molybdopterin-dependent catalytic subunit